MAFKQREKKRRKKAAMLAAQKSARSSGKSQGWWLTLVSRDTCCARCGSILRKGREMVYRAEPREARCKLCADRLSYRPSVRWERERRARARK
jgi:hypothetical protein